MGYLETIISLKRARWWILFIAYIDILLDGDQSLKVSKTSYVKFYFAGIKNEYKGSLLLHVHLSLTFSSSGTIMDIRLAVLFTLTLAYSTSALHSKWNK